MSGHTLGEYRTTEFKENRRLAKVRITPDFLLGLCKAGEPKRVRVALNALPDDVKAIGAQYDVLIGAWELALTSESFAEVDPSVMLPILDAPTWEFVTESAELTALRQQVADLRAALEDMVNLHCHVDRECPNVIHATGRRVLAATQPEEVVDPPGGECERCEGRGEILLYGRSDNTDVMPDVCPTCAGTGTQPEEVQA